MKKMIKTKKETKSFCVSVEGEVCEKYYFEHLKKLINNSGENKYNIKFTIKRYTPTQMIKSLPNIYDGKVYMHVQDVEDLRKVEYCTNLNNRIAEIKEINKKRRMEYKLGYTNYTFELWILLHFQDMLGPVNNRKNYLEHINYALKKEYNSLSMYKKEQEFKELLETYITLESVKKAIKRADKICKENEETNKDKYYYMNFSCYKDNPDLNLHELIKMIFDECGIKY